MKNEYSDSDAKYKRYLIFRQSCLCTYYMHQYTHNKCILILSWGLLRDRKYRNFQEMSIEFFTNRQEKSCIKQKDKI
jgi:hypothetical protein